MIRTNSPRSAAGGHSIKAGNVAPFPADRALLASCSTPETRCVCVRVSSFLSVLSRSCTREFPSLFFIVTSNRHLSLRHESRAQAFPFFLYRPLSPTFRFNFQHQANSSFHSVNYIPYTSSRTILCNKERLRHRTSKYTRCHESVTFSEFITFTKDFNEISLQLSLIKVEIFIYLLNWKIDKGNSNAVKVFRRRTILCQI